MVSPIIVLFVFSIYKSIVDGFILQLLITYLIVALVLAIMYFWFLLINDGTD